MMPLTAAPAQLNVTAEGKISAHARENRGAMVVGAPARAVHLLREPDQLRAPEKAHNSLHVATAGALLEHIVADTKT